MTNLIYVASGGAIGAVLRYLIMILIPIQTFPTATLIVNVLGSFILGVLIEFSALKYTLSMDMKLFLVVGMLGAFTTFSAFSLDAMTMIEKGDFKPAFIYISVSILGSLAAFFIGLWLVRKFLI